MKTAKAFNRNNRPSCSLSMANLTISSVITVSPLRDLRSSFGPHAGRHWVARDNDDYRDRHTHADRPGTLQRLALLFVNGHRALHG